MSFRMRRPDLNNLPEVTLPPGYSLRTFQPGDEAAWCALMEGQIGHGWTLEKFQKEMVDPPQFDPAGLFFVTYGGEPVASACAWRVEERYGPDTGVLHMVAVRPDHRGKRLGEAVSIAVLHFFRAKGYRDAVLNTDENRIPAVKTYLKLGFKPDLDNDKARAGWDIALSRLAASAPSGQGGTRREEKAVLGVGVVGLGYAGRQHLAAYLRHPQAEVRGVVTNRPHEAAALLAGHGRGRSGQANEALITADLNALLARPDIDLISICTPDSLHADQVEAALAAGKHVLCEKPLAPTAAECRRILEAAKASGRMVMTGQILRFAPKFQSIEKLVRTGELGTPFFAEADYLHNLEPFLHGWRADPSHRPNLVLGGGCHPIDLLRWMVGEVEAVHAYGNRQVLKGSAYSHDCIIISLQFANGCVGKVLISGGCQRPYALNLSVYGSQGTLVNDKLFLSKIDHLQDWMHLPLPEEEEYPYYYEEIDHLIHCIKTGQQPLVDAHEGARTVAVCLAADLSLQRGGPVRVADVEAEMALGRAA